MKIADKMGTTPSMLSRIFAGNVNGSLKTIRKLAEVLDLPLGTTVQAIDAWKARSKDGEAA